MPVAYSNLPIIKGTIRADSVAHLVADLDGLVARAGWTVKTTVTGGFKYTLTSPQGFQCKVLVQDAVSYLVANPSADLYTGQSVVVQFMSFDESNKGFPHQLLAHNFGVWSEMQVVVGICQLFISVAGRSGGGWSSVAGGIPARPGGTGPCSAGLASAAVTEIWWSCGGSQFPNDFRTSANCYACSTYCLNGMMHTTADDNSIEPFNGRLCLFPLTPVNTYSVPINFPAVTYSAHTPLVIDAFIGWEWKIRGQLWDAFLQTGPTGLDVTGSFQDTDAIGKPVTLQAIAWHSHFYSTLQLIFGAPTAEAGSAGSIGNVAF
jgi:hypothetical protein